MFPYRDENPSENFPIVTFFLIVINVAVFFNLTIRPDYELLVWQYGFIPGQWHFLNLITAMFLHGSISHLIFNMWYLWLFGDNLEDKLGKVPFLCFYFLGGVFAFVFHG